MRHMRVLDSYVSSCVDCIKAPLACLKMLKAQAQPAGLKSAEGPKGRGCCSLQVMPREGFVEEMLPASWPSLPLTIPSFSPVTDTNDSPLLSISNPFIAPLTGLHPVF